jgi:hypothetical protein
VPICPHTLSFRPLLFPDSAVIRIEVPADARSSPQCSFDCRDTTRLSRGDFVVVRSSPWPLPLVCRVSAAADWIAAITTKLMWNVRVRQKELHPAGGGSSGGAAGVDASAGRRYLRALEEVEPSASAKASKLTRAWSRDGGS